MTFDIRILKMTTPAWIKPIIIGGAIGAVSVAIIGFGWGGWMTSGKAAIVADNRARAEVAAAMVPICLEQSKLDPKVAETLAKLKDADTYRRNEMLMDTGWATMPGSTDANRVVAGLCMEKLAAQF